MSKVLVGWSYEFYFDVGVNMYGVTKFDGPNHRFNTVIDAPTEADMRKLHEHLPAGKVTPVYAVNTETPPANKAEWADWTVTVLPSGQMSAFLSHETIPQGYVVTHIGVHAASAWHAVDKVIQSFSLLK